MGLGQPDRADGSLYDWPLFVCLEVGIMGLIISLIMIAAVAGLLYWVSPPASKKEKVMVALIFDWLLKSALGRLVGVATGAFLLSGLLYAGCQVKGCLNERAEVRAKTAEKTLEVQDEKRKIEKETHDLSDDDLAEYFRTGRVPKRP